MGERFGPLAVSPAALAADDRGPAWSEATAAAIDAETRAIVDDAGGSAAAIVSDHARLLEALADELVAVESLEGHALDRFLSQVRSRGEDSVTAGPAENPVHAASDLVLVS